MSRVKYSDLFMDWLKTLGYTHCFYLGGGNVMHLLESASHRFKCVPFVHEVAAGIAAEYFNEVSDKNSKAFVLVTAGPALTNLVTAIAGAWTESRELLIIGGQAKVSDLSRGRYRNLGFQELDGVTICESITKEAITLDSPISFQDLESLVSISKEPRKGPVLIEFCLDISALPVNPTEIAHKYKKFERDDLNQALESNVQKAIEILVRSKRPLILIGGGIDREKFEKIRPKLESLQIPIATTFNGADRIGVDYKYYAGRPNWYGARWANLINQQADVLIALGTRLSLLQVGYNWQEYVPNGIKIQVDIDKNELEKPFPNKDYGFCCDANTFLEKLVESLLERKEKLEIVEWQNFVSDVRSNLAVPDSANVAGDKYVELHSFLFQLFSVVESRDQIIPCSSGGTYTGTMQVMLNKTGQRIVTSHAMASMGYGLSGAIGASLANRTRRTVTVEGDGGFAQNLQELGTLKANNLNLKIFIFDNRGYASIRTTQKTYFNNHYVGCDESTGLGLPDWEKLVSAYEIPVMKIDNNNKFSSEFYSLFNCDGPAVFIVKLDPEQLFFPKIGSRLNSEGVMASNPLHLMDPPLSKEMSDRFIKYV